VTSQLLLALEPPPAPTLGNFLAGANRAAVEALADVASGRTAGAMYLWGEAGTGKSHLLAAVARNGAVATIDDVDRLTGGARSSRPSTASTASAPRVGRRSPPERAARASRRCARTRSRVLSGSSSSLQPLSDEEKAAALAAHAAERGMKLPPEAVDHLLRRLPRDLGTQFAVLDAIDRYSLALKRPVTLPLVREALAALDLA
jgi:DnaA family protein